MFSGRLRGSSVDSFKNSYSVETFSSSFPHKPIDEHDEQVIIMTIKYVILFIKFPVLLI